MGLLVWIDSSDRGACPPAWKATLARHNLIWIGGNNSGNARAVNIRFGMAIDAVHNMKKRYTIDPDRIYVGGVSGGGRSASMLTIGFPEIFTGGGFYVVGCNYWNTVPAEKKGTFYQGFWGTPNPQQNALIRQAKDRSFVFLTGETDYNRFQTKEVYRGYKSAGFSHLTYLEVPRMGHVIPPPDWLEKSLAFFDEALLPKGARAYQQALSLKRTGYGRAACDKLRLAAHYNNAAAQAALQQLRKKAAETLREVDETIKRKDFTTAKNLLRNLSKHVSPELVPDLKERVLHLKELTNKTTNVPPAP